MPLDSDKIRQLLQMIQQTKEVELTCPECLDELDKYVQETLDGTPLDGLHRLVQEHLEACPFCESELKLVLETLSALEE